MFRMNRKNRKKISKEKNPNQVGKTSENKQKYQEDFNEIILNDLVPEEKRSDFGLDSVEESKPKKSGGVKLNLGLGSKKSAPKGKKSSSNSKDAINKKTKKSKNSKNSSKVDKSKQEKPKEKSKKNSNNHVSKDKSSNKDENKKTKSLLSNTKEIKEELNQPIEQNTKNNKKTNIGLKKKRIKQSSKENDIEIKRNIDENNKNYTSENNFDSVNFRGMEELEEKPLEVVVEKKQEEIKIEEPIKNRLTNLVWSEDKFPKK